MKQEAFKRAEEIDTKIKLNLMLQVDSLELEAESLMRLDNENTEKYKSEMIHAKLEYIKKCIGILKSEIKALLLEFEEL